MTGGTRTRWWERINRALYPFLGPAMLGPGSGGERETARRSTACPLCQRPLAGHGIERSADGHTATRIVCPAAEGSSGRGSPMA